MHLQGPVPTLGSSALSISAPRSRGVSAGTYSWWALIHLLLLNLDVRSWESGHLTVLHFCRGGQSVGGGGLQQHPGTLEGCSQERRKEPGPLPGEAAWGKDRPPPLQTSCNSQISCNSASLKAQGSPIRATGLHLLVREGCQRHKHNFQNPWEPCPALRSHSGPIGVLPGKHTCWNRCSRCPRGARCS